MEVVDHPEIFWNLTYASFPEVEVLSLNNLLAAPPVGKIVNNLYFLKLKKLISRGCVFSDSWPSHGLIRVVKFRCVDATGDCGIRDQLTSILQRHFDVLSFYFIAAAAFEMNQYGPCFVTTQILSRTLRLMALFTRPRKFDRMWDSFPSDNV